MIPVSNPIEEPTKFDNECRRKGLQWLAKHPGCDRPRDYWSPFRAELALGFMQRCGYSAMWISSGTVDHFVSCNEDMKLAYEWSNYRFIEGWINSAKTKKRAADLLDPFEVKDGWFEIALPSMQLKLTDKVPASIRSRAESTLKQLPLEHDERIVHQRREWLRMYEDEDVPLTFLDRKAPLIAQAIRRQRWPRNNKPYDGT